MKLTPRNIRKIIYIIACSILIFVALTNLGTVISLLGKLFKILSPVILGCCIAFVVNVIMKLFDNILFKGMSKSRFKIIRGIQRPLSIFCAFVVALGFLALAMLVIIPEVDDALTNLIQQLPNYTTNILQWLKEVLVMMDFPQDEIMELASDWTQVTKVFQGWITSYSDTLLGSAVNITVSVVGTVFDVILALFISCFILFRKERIADLLKKTCRAFFHEKRAMHLEKVGRLSNEAFSNFVAGQCIEALILGVLCFLGMLIFGFPYAPVVSMIISITALVPIFGAWIGGAVSALLILTVDPMKALLFVVYILVLQQLEGNLIYPKVVGKKVGLPGLLVLVAVIIGSKIGGIAGMVVAVPLASVIYALFKEAIDRRLEEKQKKKQRMQKETLEQEADSEG